MVKAYVVYVQFLLEQKNNVDFLEQPNLEMAMFCTFFFGFFFRMTHVFVAMYQND